MVLDILAFRTPGIRDLAVDIEGREESSNIEDRRGMSGTTGLALGGAGSVIVIIIALLLGVNPQNFLHSSGGGSSGGPEDAKLKHFVGVVFGDTERVWGEQFEKQLHKTYRKPTLVLFSGSVDSACGSADASVGPFYCPADQKVYIDLSFYQDMETKLHAPGDFARAYVIAHEVGHHVQNLLFPDEVKQVDAARRRSKAEANRMSVRLELQADYLAGVWAHHGQEKYHFLQPGDIESALNAAYQIGDDRLQKQARGTVVPDSFTHGTSKQRQRWFKKGFDTGDIMGARELFTRDYDKL